MKTSSLSVVCLLCALMILCVGGSAQAQSGRRAKERTPPPAQQPAEPAEPKPATRSEARSISLLITFDETGGGGVYLGDAQLVLRGFVERLKKNAAINHKVEKRMDRKEAGDLAKSQTESYVVWLQLDVQRISSRANNNEMFVEYAIFPPGKGKSKAEGRVYVRDSRQRIGIGNVPIGVPLPPIGTGNARLNDALLDAGRETAERVMPELDVTQIVSSQ
jgi:hypothetical protein